MNKTAIIMAIILSNVLSNFNCNYFFYINNKLLNYFHTIFEIPFVCFFECYLIFFIDKSYPNFIFNYFVVQKL